MTERTGEDRAARRALAKASWRLLPLIGLGYGISYMDRANIGYAQQTMSLDLGFSATVYGLGGGLFFLSYALLEVPSNLMLVRFGARRWIARIMLTWGALAMAMMFVRTPLQFYGMRLLLGAAEAGFFPGVMFYLMQWFPAHARGRAVTRFYVALPLSMVVMGAVAGALLQLQGRLGLAGWQWLFVIEGLPAILLSAVIFLLLPDSPATASWLTPEERGALAAGLAADGAMPGAMGDHRLLPALREPRVWLLGLANICIMGGNYAWALSAPVIVRGGTGLDATRTGYLIAAVSLLSAVSMVAAGWYSDRRRERHRHLIFYLLIQACGFAAMSAAASPLFFAAALACAVSANMAIQAVFFLIPADFLRGRSAAAGMAAVGSVGMIGAFAGPFLWGLVHDHTGGYHAGLAGLFVPYTIAALIIVILRRNFWAGLVAIPAPAEPENAEPQEFSAPAI